MPYPSTRLLLLGLVFFAGLATGCQSAGKASVATLDVTSATVGGSLSGQLVEGILRFRGNDYRVTLRGVARSVRTRGSVSGIVRAQDIEGIYVAGDGGLRNAGGVTIAFDPPVELAAGRLEIEIANRVSPKVSGGQPGSGVE